MWSVKKCRVWSAECKVRSVECKVWSGECKKTVTENEIRAVEQQKELRIWVGVPAASG